MAAGEMTDEQLAEAFRQGDTSAMEEMLARYRSYVKARARSFFLAGSEMEDLIQEGMIGLYKAVRDYRPDKNTCFKSFAFLCINRQIFTAIKGANREKHRILTESLSLNAPITGENDENIYIDVADEKTASNPEEAVISREMYDVLQKNINELLSVEERRILHCYLDGLSYNEIGEKLSLPPKRIDNALQRIKKKLSKKTRSIYN